MKQSDIQLEPGPSSSATHRITQAGHTLNRRYVSRPTNLAIEAAAYVAPASAPSVDTAPSVRPSRLVNLHIHDADLARLQEESIQEEPTPEPIVTAPTPSNTIDLTDSQEYVYEEAKMPEEMPAEEFSALAMSIAEDYTVASLGATVHELPERIEQYTDNLSLAVQEAKVGSSVDEIAQTAAEAIAAIRSASDPADAAAQIESLKKFSDKIKSNAEIPEILELGETIDKFITIAEKSTVIKTDKAEKAKAAKVAISTPAPVKVSTSSKKAAKPVAKIRKPILKAITKPSPKPASKPTPKVAIKPTPRIAAKTVAKPVKPTPKLAPKPLAKSKTKLALSANTKAAIASKPAAKISTARIEPTQKHRTKKKGNVKRFVLAFGCATAAVAAIIYFVGTNIPDISVRVAAMQTGVDASYPSYVPRDYSLQGISSEEKKITLTFSGPNNASFTLSEEKSSWDSTALLRNFVENEWGEGYSTTHEQGITIFTFGSNATWVNGGVLYKITSKSGSLTTKQLRNIVTSMM